MSPKKPAFPSRPCPKCHKPIHIKSKKHDECGWRADDRVAPVQNGAPAMKLSPDVNKSAAVAEILDKHPKMPVKEIVKTLAAQGVTISGNYIYTLLSKLKAKKKSDKRQQTMAVSPTSVTIATRAPASPLELIRDVKQLAARAGGLSTLKELVDVLAE